jgi:hypothetical protein
MTFDTVRAMVAALIPLFVPSSNEHIVRYFIDDDLMLISYR